MKAALALIFFACVAGSMASAPGQIVEQLLQQGQAVAQSVLTQLQQQIAGFVQQALGSLKPLIGTLGRFDLFQQLVDQFKPQLSGLINQALAGVLGQLTGLLGGGRAAFDFNQIFGSFLQEVLKPIKEIGTHLASQGLASVLGGLGGSRGINDIWNSLTSQVSGAVSVAQGVLNGALGNLANLGQNLLDASKPHWSQLQEQLVGHGLNVLGSISETVNNLHGSITGGR